MADLWQDGAVVCHERPLSAVYNMQRGSFYSSSLNSVVGSRKMSYVLNLDLIVSGPFENRQTFPALTLERVSRGENTDNRLLSNFCSELDYDKQERKFKRRGNIVD